MGSNRRASKGEHENKVPLTLFHYPHVVQTSQSGDTKKYPSNAHRNQEAADLKHVLELSVRHGA